MMRKFLLFFALVSLLTAPLDAGLPGPVSKLTAAEIVERNAAARGGLAAWRNVHTLSMSGKMDAGGKPPVQLPVLLELKRPRKVRIELEFKGDTAVQVFDGTNGWKLRPFLNRRDVEPYTPAEMKAATLQSDLDGPLMDYATKGSSVELVGTEKVEGRDAYQLKVTMKDGQSTHVWVDADTFLETKIEGTPRRLNGRYHPVSTFLRDYRTVDGLKFPYVLETKVQDVIQTEKILIEKVLVNPALQDSLFTKPK